jgi:hypothetical protein
MIPIVHMWHASFSFAERLKTEALAPVGSRFLAD